MNRVGSDGKEVWNGEETNLQIVNYTPETDENLIDEMIPFEMLSNIFSRLSDKDIENTCLTSHYWKDVSVDAVTHKEFSKIKDFANFLAQCLKNETYAKVIAEEIFQLVCIGSEMSCPTLENLMKAKSLIHDIKENILNILKNVRIDLIRLEELSKNEPKPKFFDDVFILAKIYKQIEIANALPLETKSDALFKVIEALIQSRSLNKAEEVAYTIPDESYKSTALIYICLALSQNQNFDKAIEIANIFLVKLLKIRH